MEQRYYLVMRHEDSKASAYEPGLSNLNRDCGGEWLFLYKTWYPAKRKAPIYDIMVYYGPDGSTPLSIAEQQVKDYAEANGWEIVTYAMTDQPADLNLGTGDNYIYLLVKKDYPTN